MINVKKFRVTRNLYDYSIDAEIICTGSGINITLTGGERPHIGAITIIAPDGKMETKAFPTHRESVISEEWAKSIYDATGQPVVVAAGIHYEGATQEMISAVVNITKEMLLDVMKEITATQV